MSTPAPDFKLAAGPLAFHAQAAPATGKVTVYNQGAKPLDVTSSTLHLAGKCGNLHMVPSSFQLKPGTHAVVTVTDHVQNADLGAKFSAIIHGQKGLGTAGGIAVRFVTGKPAGTAACVTPKSAPLAPVGGGAVFEPWMAMVLLVLLVLAVVVVKRIRKRRA